MRGVQVDSQRFRQLRRARGLSQRELATRAGVGERTVRNVETGRRVRLDFLGYLAAALSVDVADVVHDRDELRTVLREQRRAELILKAMEAQVRERDFCEILNLLARDVRYTMHGPADVPLCGEYRKPDGLRTLVDQSTAAIAYEDLPKITDVRTSGNLVVINGIDCLRALPTGKSFSTPWMHVYEFDKGNVVRVDSWADTAVIAQAFQPD